MPRVGTAQMKTRARQCTFPPDLETPHLRDERPSGSLWARGQSFLLWCFPGYHGTPKTTFYQLSLDVLALCLETEDIEEAAASLAKEAAVRLAKEALAKDFSVGKSCYSVHQPP